MFWVKLYCTLIEVTLDFRIKGSVYIWTLLLMCFSGVKVWDDFLLYFPTTLPHFWVQFFLDSHSFCSYNHYGLLISEPAGHACVHL